MMLAAKRPDLLLPAKVPFAADLTPFPVPPVMGVQV